MKISVIVPIYNRLEHFRALFICLLRQNRQIDELIITDDGSSQQILDYIADLIPKASFKIKHIYQEDKGFRKTRALNNGVINSEGELLVFCDQDLIFGEEYIEYMEKNIKKGCFLLCRPISINEEEKDIILKKIELSNKYEELLKALPKNYLESVNKTLKTDRKRRILNILKLSKRGIKLVGMSYAVMKSDYLKVNGYDENYNGWGEEDDDFGNRLYVAGVKGKELKTPNMQIHLWHYSDPTKKHSMNEEYYYKRKREIFSNKNYFCKNGCSEARDDIKITMLK